MKLCTSLAFTRSTYIQVRYCFSLIKKMPLRTFELVGTVKVELYSRYDYVCNKSFVKRAKCVRGVEISLDRFRRNLLGSIVPPRGDIYQEFLEIFKLSLQRKNNDIAWSTRTLRRVNGRDLAIREGVRESRPRSRLICHGQRRAAGQLVVYYKRHGEPYNIISNTRQTVRKQISTKRELQP